MATPHISADPGDFAPAVLMPGDPRRAKLIAETYFDNPRLVTEVRGILGYTGTINGKPISAMASGMGQPSMTIYATELFKFYGVQRIIRVGTAGAFSESVKMRDVVIGIGAFTDSKMNAQRVPGIDFCAVASFELVAAAVAAAGDSENVHLATLFSSDHFYLERPGLHANLAKYGCVAVEMEAAALYAAAAEFGTQALSICTMSDHLLTGEELSAEQRQTDFATAAEIAIAAALS